MCKRILAILCAVLIVANLVRIGSAVAEDSINYELNATCEHEEEFSLSGKPYVQFFPDKCGIR